MPPQTPIDLTNNPNVQVVDLSDDPNVRIVAPGRQAPILPPGAFLNLPLSTPTPMPRPEVGIRSFDRGTRIKETAIRNAPAILGTLGSAAAAVATGGASIPVQVGAGLAASSLGAGAGSLARQSLDAIPEPPTAKETGKDVLKHGVLPEVTGGVLGLGGRLGGNVIARVGAGKRNQKLAEKLANPKSIPMSPSGREVGGKVQSHIVAGREAAEAPIKQGYKDLYEGPFGDAKRLVVKEDFIPTPNAQTVVPVGPSNRRRAQIISEAKEDARGFRQDPSKRKEARAAQRRAQVNEERMAKAADDQGLTMDEYNRLNQAYGKIQGQFGNTFQNQIQSKKGTDVIELLTNPSQWKSFKSPGAKVKEDVPNLVQNLRSTVDDGMWDTLTTAVQKRLVRRSTDAQGNIRPQQLATQLKKIIDAGGGDIVPQAQKLLEMAEVLAKGSGGIPPVNTRASILDRGLKMVGMDAPDAARALKLKGRKGTGQKLLEWLGKAATQGAQFEIPEPPAME